MILTLKKGAFSILFKQSSTKAFHIAGPLIENLYLVLLSFNLGFQKFKVGDLVEYRWEILWKLPVKTGGYIFVWTLCINTTMRNILSKYKFSTFVDLKSSFGCSNFVLLLTIRIACFCWLRSFFRFVYYVLPQSKLASLTLSCQRPLSYRNQSIDFLRKSMDWFLYDNGLRHERVKIWVDIGLFQC